MSEDDKAIGWGESWYWRLRRRITPGLRNAQYAYFETLDRLLQQNDHWLDLGCGRRLAPQWMADGADIEQKLLGRAGHAVGVDPDSAALSDNALPLKKHLAMADRVPEPDGAFDLVTANMVVEHVSDPGEVLREAARLLRPGGRVLFHTPNRVYPLTLAASAVPAKLRQRLAGWLERRALEDIYPTHYRLNTVAAIERAAKRAGLEMESIERVADSPETVRLGPLVAIELALIGLTRAEAFAFLRSNLIVTLRLPAATVLPMPQATFGAAA